MMEFLHGMCLPNYLYRVKVTKSGILCGKVISGVWNNICDFLRNTRVMGHF